jgi:hypothetical protein
VNESLFGRGQEEVLSKLLLLLPPSPRLLLLTIDRTMEEDAAITNSVPKS